MAIIRKYWAEIALSAITIIGLALRLYHLDFQKYFPEELLHIGIIQSPGYLSTIQFGSEQAPLYYFFAKISVVVMHGLSPLSLRLPAALFGTLCILAIYFLGKEFGGSLVGILSAAIIALSDRAIFYSQYGRPYSLTMLVFIIATYCFVKIQREEPFRKWMALFVITSGVCLWSHYYSIIPLSILWSIIIWQNRQKVVSYLIVLILAAIPFILYISGIINEYLSLPISTIHIQSIFEVTWVDMLFRVPYECWGYLTIILIPLFILYLIKRKDPITCYFGLVVIITYLSLVIITFISNAGARYAVLIAPLIIVPAMMPISELIKCRTGIIQKIALFSGVVYIILITNLPPLIAWYTTTYHFVFL